MPALEQVIWEDIWKDTVEKSQTNVTNVIMPPLWSKTWNNIWQNTMGKSQTNAVSKCSNLYIMKRNQYDFHGANSRKLWKIRIKKHWDKRCHPVLGSFNVARKSWFFISWNIFWPCILLGKPSDQTIPPPLGFGHIWYSIIITQSHFHYWHQNISFPSSVQHGVMFDKSFR